jgi:predicted N-acetyltransferase YhbS
VAPVSDTSGQSIARRGIIIGIVVRSYRHPDDFHTVGRFLVRTYDPEAAHRNWLQPRWEYMHFHPMLDDQNLDRFGVWEDEGEIVGVAHYENKMGVSYVQLDPAYGLLKREILAYAADTLWGEFNVGKAVHVYIDEDDPEFQAIAMSLGFTKLPREQAEITSWLKAVDLPEENAVPAGFEIVGLDEDDDVGKVHRVMHRGFNHEGEPPEDEIDDRRWKLSSPSLRKDLTVVARATNGDFVSFCGMWVDPANRVAYVEPVATDPDYRRMGLGTAVVLEGLRRCAAEGSTVAYVGSEQPFYRSMGFTICHAHALWRRVLED